MYWSSATGTQTVTGATLTAYTRAGGAKGIPGYPIAGEKSDGIGGYVQSFHKGRTVWSRLTGASAAQGSIGARYLNAKGQAGVLGHPTAAEAPTSTGGSYQKLQKGRICRSSATGAREVLGRISTAYVGLGGTASRLGFPTSGETRAVDGSTVQRFQGGTITLRTNGTIRIDHH
jgi:uncharacterized protein with LGFP repeats